MRDWYLKVKFGVLIDNFNVETFYNITIKYEDF